MELDGRGAERSPGRRRALFVDRDGVLNRRVVDGYVTRPDGLVVLPGIVPVLAGRGGGAPVVVVSNQGCIARGLATAAEVAGVNAALRAELESRGGPVDAVYVCPHHPRAARPEDRMCGCRKPAPGLLLAAADDLGIDLARSLLLGDQLSDVAAARAAGVPEDRARLVDPETMSAADVDALAAEVADLLAGPEES